MVVRAGVRRTSVGVACLVCALAFSACGSSEKKTAPAAYVSQVCTSIGGLLRTVQSGAATLAGASGKLRSPAEGKAALSQLLGSAVSAADQAVAGLKAAGTPDVSGGKEIAKRLVGAFEEVKS